MTEVFTIKPLKWKAQFYGYAESVTPLGMYWVHKDGWHLLALDRVIAEGDAKDIAAAKAAADAHYIAWVKRCLMPVTPDIAAPETDINVSTLERAVRDWGQFNQSGMFKGGE
jgi:hypothetical protein